MITKAEEQMLCDFERFLAAFSACSGAGPHRLHDWGFSDVGADEKEIYIECASPKEKTFGSPREAALFCEGFATLIETGGLE
jgi:hypothetical protein